jgi:rare lipoprotein A
MAGEVGIRLVASWYNKDSLIKEGTWKNGERRMANGQRFDENRLTSACNLYPLNSWLLVTNIESGKSVIVRNTDRIGRRFGRTRVDLPKGVMEVLGGKQGLEKGLLPVKVEILK